MADYKVQLDVKGPGSSRNNQIWVPVSAPNFGLAKQTAEAMYGSPTTKIGAIHTK